MGKFILGVGVGFLGGILLAPKTGAQTRKMISKKASKSVDYMKDRASDGVEYAKDMADDGVKYMAGMMGKGKKLVASRADDLVKAGVQKLQQVV